MALAMGLGLAYSSPRYRVALVCAGVVGFLAELSGVWTGFPFGGYVYTEAFAPLLFGVPLVMICAWAVLAGYLHGLLAPWVRHPLALTAAGALGLTAIDLVLDPVAANIMNLWTWEHAGYYYGIPLSNFAGWLLVGLVVFGVLLLLGKGQAVSPKLRLLGLSMVLFITAIAVGQRLFWPACWGAALCAGHFALTRKGEARSPAGPLSHHAGDRVGN